MSDARGGLIQRKNQICGGAQLISLGFIIMSSKKKSKCQPLTDVDLTGDNGKFSTAFGMFFFSFFHESREL